MPTKTTRPLNSFIQSVLGNMVIFILQMILCCIFVYGDVGPLEESVSEHIYLIPIEIKKEKSQIKDDSLNYLSIPSDFNKQNLSSGYYNERKNSIEKDDNESVEYLRNYANMFNYINYMYDHNIYSNNTYSGSRNAVQLNSPRNREVYYITLKPLDIIDSQLRNYKHETMIKLKDENVESAFISPTIVVEYKSYINNKSDKRFKSYSNAPESIFHTQVNVNSPGSKLNVANSFPLLNDISTEVSDVDEILEPVIDQPIPETDKATYSVEVICTPDMTKVNLCSDLRDDGYHYDRPRDNFFD
ncbi:uncharacterized protein LOC126761559 [Bactrocera neohumeralis]|uniref:uncharacterized protein LOC126761559 n=1 Tax=Bactrocera neohumeralis TaxID=98809 RepID=UPI002166B48E|nr:uncharacterized protein LOC126761559 [Bactrocera neohumeralis]